VVGQPANPSAARTTHAKLSCTTRYSFLRVPRRFQASQPAGRKIPAQCVSTGRATVPAQPRNGAGESGWRSFFRPVPGLANAACLLPTALRRGLLSVALRALRAVSFADWQSACALWKGSFGHRNATARQGNQGQGTLLPRLETAVHRSLSYSEFVRKNSLVTSFQFVPGSAASRSSAGRPPSAATAPASAGCRA
jgi:hypothetical protein